MMPGGCTTSRSRSVAVGLGSIYYSLDPGFNLVGQHSEGHFMKQLILLLGLLIPVAGWTQPFAMESYNLSGGAGVGSGGYYSLRGVIGQPDAGVIGGGAYRLQGGFLAELVVPATGQAPMLVIRMSETGVSISWAPATSGFVLEQADDLSVPVWSAAQAGNPVVIPFAKATRFFRLEKAP
jgi:hypothetical protein